VYNNYIQRNIYKTGDLGRYAKNRELMFTGRADQQVKIRGFRIELGEIESHIMKYPDIKMVVVESIHRSKEETELCVFYTEYSTIREENLKKYLQENLPDYMVPKYYKQLKEFPTTPVGKIDRQYLHNTEIRGIIKSDYIAPRNICETELVEIWRDILGIDEISVIDDFFNLGGHSLKAMMIIHKIQDKYGVRMPISMFSSLSTIEKLSNYIEGAEHTKITFERSEKRKYYPLLSVQKQVYAVCTIFDNLHESYNNTFQ